MIQRTATTMSRMAEAMTKAESSVQSPISRFAKSSLRQYPALEMCPYWHLASESFVEAYCWNSPDIHALHFFGHVRIEMYLADWLSSVLDR